MKVRFFDPGLSYRKIKNEIDTAMQDVLERGDLVLRKDLEEFEENLAKYVGTKHAIGVANGTDAIYLSLMAFGVGPSDVVLAPSYTFRATVDSPLRLGCKVRLYDFGRPHFDKDITVWIPAHIAGLVPNWMESAIREAKKRNILIIEDYAQAIGAAPIRGATACYSFYPAKILGCYGDGGAICTNDDDIANWLRRARNHFKGENGEIGLNSRLDNLQAAVLNVKIKHLPEAIFRRKQIALLYDKGLKGVGVDTERTVYQDYIITCKNRDGLYDYLAKEGVETMKNGYPFAAECEKGLMTSAYEAKSLRLPCNPDLTDEEINYVIEKINVYAGTV